MSKQTFFLLLIGKTVEKNCIIKLALVFLDLKKKFWQACDFMNEWFISLLNM